MYTPPAPPILGGEKKKESSSPKIGEEGRGISVHLEKWPEVKELTKEQEELLKQMAEIRDVVEETHALRAKAGIKLRQPLARLIVPSVIPGLTRNPDPGSRLVGRDDNALLSILKDEVNVKDIVYGDNLELDTEMTSELKQEGLVRELTRVIQGLRKEMGLKIGENAEIEYETTSEEIKLAMERVDKSKVYIVTLRQAQGLTGGKEAEVEGEKIKILISNVQSNPKNKNSKL